MKDFKFFNNKPDSQLPEIVELVHRIIENRDTGNIVYPLTLTNPFDRDLFRSGWIACRSGQNIWDSPYETENYRRQWEYGWTSYYHISNRIHEPIAYEDLFSTGYNAAREGYPRHDNPWDMPRTQYQKRVWDEGWDDFTNNH
jgi:hypothetical protein